MPKSARNLLRVWNRCASVNFSNHRPHGKQRLVWRLRHEGIRRVAQVVEDVDHHEDAPEHRDGVAAQRRGIA